jgi:hypothetical protein
MFTEGDGEAWKHPELRIELPEPLLSPEQDTLPEGTDAGNPLEIWLGKDVLLEAIRASLESINAYRTSMDRNLEDIEHTDELIIQRRRFRAWLESHPLTHVYVSIVPRQSHQPGVEDDDAT